MLHEAEILSRKQESIPGENESLESGEPVAEYPEDPERLVAKLIGSAEQEVEALSREGEARMGQANNSVSASPEEMRQIRDNLKIEEILGQINIKAEDIFVEMKRRMEAELAIKETTMVTESPGEVLADVSFEESGKSESKFESVAGDGEKKDQQVALESRLEVAPESGEGDPEEVAAEIVGEEMLPKEDPDLNPEGAKIEIFDPELELKNIRKGTKEEQREKLARFKEQLLFQKRCIATSNRGIIAAFEQNPQLDPEDFFSRLQPFFDQAKLAGGQREVMKSVIEKLSEQNKKVSAFLENYRTGESGELDPAGVYEGLFGKKPNGRVEVISTGVSIQLRIEDIKDYAFITSKNYHLAPGTELTESQLSNAAQTAGMKTMSRLQPELGGSIIIENCSVSGSFDDRDNQSSRETRQHEQQHVYNGIMQLAYNADQATATKRSDALKASVDKRLGDVKKAEIISDEDAEKAIEYSKKSRSERERILNNAGMESAIKDEISAYFTENDHPSAAQIRLTLLGQDTLYNQYNERYKASEGSEGKRGKFSEEYMRKVEDGIVAFERMINAGYVQQDAQSLLYSEPLGSWGRMADRFIGTAAGKNEIKKDLRSRVEDFEIRRGVELIESAGTVGEFIEIIRNLPPLPGEKGGEIDPTAVVQIAKDIIMEVRSSGGLEDFSAWKAKVESGNILPVGNEKIKHKFLGLLYGEGIRVLERFRRKQEEQDVMRQCERCHAKISAKASFCTNCGQKQ